MYEKICEPLESTRYTNYGNEAERIQKLLIEHKNNGFMIVSKTDWVVKELTENVKRQSKPKKPAPNSRNHR